MKLSDIKGDRVLDVIADIIDPIANMVQDKDVAAMFKREAVPDGMEARDFFAKRMCKGLPVLLKGHKADIIAIMANISQNSGWRSISREVNDLLLCTTV